MLDFIDNLLNSESLSPHGICLLWRPELIWTHVVSDALIASAYLSIPIALGYLVSKRDDIAFGWIFWCFVTFILACGTTHVLSIFTLWYPIYGVEAVVKVITALASVATAIALWPLLPRVLALPSPRQLRAANESLEARVIERDRALVSAEQANQERLKTEEMLRQSQKMEAIGQLTGGMAHDFNNLMTIVVANLERIQRRLPRDSAMLRQVEDAMAGAERAAAVTHKLLAFSRNQPLYPIEVDVNRLLVSLSELLRGAIENSVVWQSSLASDLWPVRADPNQLENAVVNLAVNARDAMDGKQSGRLEITTRNVGAAEATSLDGLESGQDYVMIEIADSGVGMPADIIRRAFEPFFTTKPVGQGTGLGLSQVFGFVKQSGGHATIESSPGLGTNVRLFLPRLKSDIQAVAPAPARTPWTAAFPLGVVAAT